jgi:SAGA-associated factor 29
MKSRKDGMSKQPLQPGRKVAFRPPKDPGNTDENEWIIAIVTRVINAKDGKYEVQDAEPQEDGQPGQVYVAMSKLLVPLPDQGALPGSPAHLSSYPIFPVNSTVLALYPDTSCFYRAEVIEAPTDISSASSKYDPTYKVRFDDDDMPSQVVTAYRVVQCPAHFLVPPKANGVK